MHRWGLNADVCADCEATRQEEAEAGGLACDREVVRVWREGWPARQAVADRRWAEEASAAARAEYERVRGALETVLRAAQARRRG